MSKIYKLYATVYKEKIDLLDKQVEQAKLELESRTGSFNQSLDQLKQNPASALVLSLIDRSLLSV